MIERLAIGEYRVGYIGERRILDKHHPRFLVAIRTGSRKWTMFEVCNEVRYRLADEFDSLPEVMREAAAVIERQQHIDYAQPVGP